MPPSNEILYSLEPEHSPLVSCVQSRRPFNAEPCVSDLVEFALTPEELIYCRNHSPVRVFNEEEYELTLKLDNGKHVTWTVPQLKQEFEKVQVIAALQCAGNRRREMASLTGKKVSGVLWEDAVISNCSWGGVRVRDLLIHAGATVHDSELHVHFESHAAVCEDDDYYGSSVPFAKAISLDDQVLIAWEMNSNPLTPAHGGPLRVVVPGYLGARWVKWVDTVVVAAQETPNFYMQRDYKVLPPEIDTKVLAAPLWPSYPAMKSLPLNSVVATVIPTSSSTIFVKGYAVPCFSDPYLEPKNTSYNNVSAIEVSMDEGKIWHPARITYQHEPWSWTLWEAELAVLPGQSVVEVCSRAIDKRGNIQPKEVVWNLRGVAWNSWGCRKVDLSL